MDEESLKLPFADLPLDNGEKEEGPSDNGETEQESTDNEETEQESSNNEETEQEDDNGETEQEASGNGETEQQASDNGETEQQASVNEETEQEASVNEETEQEASDNGETEQQAIVNEETEQDSSDNEETKQESSDNEETEQESSGNGETELESSRMEDTSKNRDSMKPIKIELGNDIMVDRSIPKRLLQSSRNTGNIGHQLSDNDDSERHVKKQRVHMDEEDNNLGKEQEETQIKCQYKKCNVVKASEKDLCEHFELKHCQELQCKSCKMTYSYRSKLRRHIRQVHINAEVNCDNCGEPCKNSASLSYHIRTKHTHRNNECPTCHAKFRSPSDVKDHINIYHEKAKTFVCDHDECGKTFNTLSGLINHKYFHGKDRFFCKCCKRGFKTASNMDRHKKSNKHKKTKNKNEDFATDSE